MIRAVLPRSRPSSTAVRSLVLAAALLWIVGSSPDWIANGDLTATSKIVNRNLALQAIGFLGAVISVPHAPRDSTTSSDAMSRPLLVLIPLLQLGFLVICPSEFLRRPLTWGPLTVFVGVQIAIQAVRIHRGAWSLRESVADWVQSVAGFFPFFVLAHLAFPIHDWWRTMYQMSATRPDLVFRLAAVQMEVGVQGAFAGSLVLSVLLGRPPSRTEAWLGVLAITFWVLIA